MWPRSCRKPSERFEPAVSLCRRVIEIDTATEAFHQGLMRGLRPSAQTLALRERIEAV